jgi:hypothetical protein
MYIDWSYRHGRDLAISGEDVNDMRLSVFYHSHVEKLLFRLKSSDALIRLDGPAEVFACLLAVTPSAPLASQMFASTFQQRFCCPSPAATGTAATVTAAAATVAAAAAALDMTDITCRDVLASGQQRVTVTKNKQAPGTTGARDVNAGAETYSRASDDFHFSLLECTFNLDPNIRSVISAQVAALVAAQTQADLLIL